MDVHWANIYNPSIYGCMARKITKLATKMDIDIDDGALFGSWLYKH